MAKLVWRYSDDAGAVIENVYKFYMEEKKYGMKLSLNRVWDCSSHWCFRSTAQKSVEKKKRHMTSSNSQSNHRHLRRKCHWVTLTRVLTVDHRQHVLLEEGSANHR